MRARALFIGSCQMDRSILQLDELATSPHRLLPSFTFHVKQFDLEHFYLKSHCFLLGQILCAPKCITNVVSLNHLNPRSDRSFFLMQLLSTPECCWCKMPMGAKFSGRKKSAICL